MNQWFVDKIYFSEVYTDNWSQDKRLLEVRRELNLDSCGTLSKLKTGTVLSTYQIIFLVLKYVQWVLFFLFHRWENRNSRNWLAERFITNKWQRPDFQSRLSFVKVGSFSTKCGGKRKEGFIVRHFVRLELLGFCWQLDVEVVKRNKVEDKSLYPTLPNEADIGGVLQNWRR